MLLEQARQASLLELQQLSHDSAAAAAADDQLKAPQRNVDDDVTAPPHDAHDDDVAPPHETDADCLLETMTGPRFTSTPAVPRLNKIGRQEYVSAVLYLALSYSAISMVTILPALVTSIIYMYMSFGAVDRLN